MIKVNGLAKEWPYTLFTERSGRCFIGTFPVPDKEREELWAKWQVLDLPRNVMVHVGTPNVLLTGGCYEVPLLIAVYSALLERQPSYDLFFSGFFDEYGRILPDDVGEKKKLLEPHQVAIGDVARNVNSLVGKLYRGTIR